MFSLVEDLPGQLARSGTLPGLDRLERLSRRPRRVLLCGMGGSAIAGDLVRPFLAGERFSLDVSRDYGLPAWVDEGTLVVASSYSGNTEETLSAQEKASRRGCPLLALTSGGELLARSRDDAGPAGGFGAVVLPGGLPPRASLGYGLGSLLWGLHRLGLIESPGAEIDQAVATLTAGNEIHRPASADNPAVRLAGLCQGRFVVLYTTSPEAHGAGLRLKTQLNENAKCPAYSVPLPELDHNDIVGWNLGPDLREHFVLLVVRGGDEGERARQRAAVSVELLADQFTATGEITPRGPATLARILSLVQFGDYLSCHLAVATGVDPVPVERIDVLKRRLAEGQSA